ncbi:S41 family peptidase [Poritiphilus flavus]|uniref:Peptidase S41 n=1 Tax=Poritiphilus flavus TaxID=2697053 RepID=A0A6L9EE16_9FLAO|nr:S41 family peptidase [Poritiphilus flavus]NAS13004.1 peptidase S41 [Poritiphilus flavus]
MKYFILSLIAMIVCHISIAQDRRNIENLVTFAKVYGYIKYFHPSDEASSLDWNSFSIYGAEQIIKCRSTEETVEALNKLFKPIAPGAKFYISNKINPYDLEKITPKNLIGYQTTYWQHRGVHLGMSYDYNDTYRSVRVNAKKMIFKSDDFGQLTTIIDAQKYKGKKIRYSGWVKMENGSDGTGHLRFQTLNSDETTGFFDNMKNQPIVENVWKQYQIEGIADSTAKSFIIGCQLRGRGTLYFDKVELSYEDKGKWFSIPLDRGGFETETLYKDKSYARWGYSGKGYSFAISENESSEGYKSARIKFTGIVVGDKEKKLYSNGPKFGELIEKKVGENIFCQIPLVLYSNEQNTFPQAKTEELVKLQKELENDNYLPENLEFRLGNVLNVYNVFQHFFPYFKEVGVDWEAELRKALLRCYDDKTEKDHLQTLQKFTAPLKDGHINISRGKKPYYALPISWEWIEDKLVVTRILDAQIPINIGDVITHINGINSKEYFTEIRSRISAGTKGWLDHISTTTSIYGDKDSRLIVTIGDKEIDLRRKPGSYHDARSFNHYRPAYKILNDSVMYLNITTIEMETINELMPQLQKSKSIICDLRGYPNKNHEFIRHLLKSNDTTKSWMMVPKIIYPDQENLLGYEARNWMEVMKSKKPFLGDKQVIFITNGEAISYAESYMGYIKGYELATIVGQPTAGTNGNANSFELPGGYVVTWTGMKVVKHDGSQLHAIGILPDIYVNKTIQGLKSGKDEFLEKAIELTREKRVHSP